MDNNEQVARFDTDYESNGFVEKHISNVKSNIVTITDDKLENILLKHKESLRTEKGWVAPFNLFIPFLLTNFSATFSTKFGLAASTWEALFIISAIASFIWLSYSLINKWHNQNESSIEFILGKIFNTDKT